MSEPRPARTAPAWRALLVDAGLLLAVLALLALAWRSEPSNGFAGFDAAARVAIERQLGASPEPGAGVLARVPRERHRLGGE